jgi:LacI family transcriptional regulator
MKLAVLANHAVAAHDLADLCQNLGLCVPDDVAILGVGDDELECDLAFPALSSVAIPGERIGFEAAKLLDEMLAGKRAAQMALYLPPVRVITRQSTNNFAVDEPVVTAALHSIRNHFAGPLKVSALAAAVKVRRRVLEERFRSLLGRSVLAEVHRVRVEHLKALLAESKLSMSQVAQQSGFSSRQRMASVFRKLTGLSPSQYRRQVQARQPPR